MAPLSDYEQPLSIRERDAGIVTARDADTHVTDTALRVLREVATRRHKVRRRHGATLICKQSLSNHKRDGKSVMMARDTQ